MTETALGPSAAASCWRWALAPEPWSCIRPPTWPARNRDQPGQRRPRCAPHPLPCPGTQTSAGTSYAAVYPGLAARRLHPLARRRDPGGRDHHRRRPGDLAPLAGQPRAWRQPGRGRCATCSGRDLTAR